MSARRCQAWIPESSDGVEHRRCDNGPARLVALKITYADMTLGVWLCPDHGSRETDGKEVTRR